MQTVNCLKISQIVAIYIFIQFQFDKKKMSLFCRLFRIVPFNFVHKFVKLKRNFTFFYNFIFHRKCQIREIIEFLSKNLENVNKLSRFTLLFSHPFWDFIVKMSQPEKYWILVKNVNKLSRFFVENVNKLWRFFCFLSGESMDPDAMICMLEYKNVDGEERPVLMFFKHGLEEIKCWKDQLKTNHFTSNFF